MVQVNEYGANLTKENPSKFSFFAALPIPDLNASLAELAYALDILNAWGITLMANLHGKYLGDPQYEPLWGELDKRGTVSAPCSIHLMRDCCKSSQITSCHGMPAAHDISAPSTLLMRMGYKRSGFNKMSQHDSSALQQRL